MSKKSVAGLIAAAIIALISTWLVSGGYVTQTQIDQVESTVKTVTTTPAPPAP